MAAAVLVAAAGCKPDAPPDPAATSLTLQTSDGLHVAATLRVAADRDAPGLILVHQYGSDRGSWDAFAIQALREGYSTISFDMRGHGETAGLNPDAPKYRGFSPGDWEGVLRDIDAAKRALIDAGADPDRIGIVGASIGANLATWYAGATEGIHALVLLSPGREYKGVEVAKPFAAYGKRPSLLLAGEGDRYSAETCRELNASAEGFCELREFPGTYHGTDLLDASPNVAAQILEWCDTALKHATDPEEAR